MMTRFHVGLPPDEFESTTGWNALSEPSARELARASIPMALILFSGSLAAWHLLDVSALRALQVRNAVDVLELVLGFFLLLVVHELVHACFHPGLGFSGSSVLGVSFRPALLYASYQATLSRNRFMAILLAPFAVLSVLPLVAHSAGLLSDQGVGGIAAAAAVNAAASSVDVLGAYLVVRQVPRTGQIRNKGWQTYWRRHVA
jgi:Putative zincin peptidase